jgi:hypothetical protein
MSAFEGDSVLRDGFHANRMDNPRFGQSRENENRRGGIFASDIRVGKPGPLGGRCRRDRQRARPNPRVRILPGSKDVAEAGSAAKKERRARRRQRGSAREPASGPDPERASGLVLHRQGRPLAQRWWKPLVEAGRSSGPID